MSEITLGIIGGGQLGRMMIQSAIDLDVRVEVMDPSPDAPCSSLTHRFVCADLNDADAVFEFGKDLDIITIEIENVTLHFPRPRGIIKSILNLFRSTDKGGKGSFTALDKTSI